MQFQIPNLFVNLKKNPKSSVLCRIIDTAMIFLRSVELSAQEPNAVLHVMLRTL